MGLSWYQFERLSQNVNIRGIVVNTYTLYIYLSAYPLRVQISWYIFQWLKCTLAWYKNRCLLRIFM